MSFRRSEGQGSRLKSSGFSRLKLIYEDEDIIVVDKPAGLLTMATEKERRKTAYAFLYAYVKNKRPAEKIFIVHRLDREASGLLVFAKTQSAKRRLQDQFKDHSATRKYVAVVEGRAPQDLCRIESYLAENAAHRAYSSKDRTKAKLAVTHIRVLRRFRQTTLIEARLESGRKHQIRAHLSERGHPIVGDRDYGSQINRLHRLALHAVNLNFKHPETGKLLQFESPYPDSFRFS